LLKQSSPESFPFESNLLRHLDESFSSEINKIIENLYTDDNIGNYEKKGEYKLTHA